MGNPASISCTKCSKEYKVEDKMLGASVKCKACGEHFVAAISKPNEVNKSSASAPTSQDDEEEDGRVGKAYGIVLESETAKCPNCAKELIGTKAIICVHCGFNSRTRTWNRTKKIVERTPVDYMWWHLPAIASSIVVLISIVMLVVYFWKVPGWADANPNDTLPWLLNTLFVRIYMTIMVLYIAWSLGFYAIKRFVYFPHPPEEEIIDK